ncbi:MAG TPA: FxsA family protein [Solirubrobacteraceae bacterium]|nr:FxsA family protein [Solirubrobacteraceae bacterium]
MILPLVLLFIVVPIVEIYVIIQVGEAIGALWTIALLIADSILGSMLMRTQGRAAWRRFNEAIAGGRIPAREVLDGVLIVFGGALLLTPGFVTDIFGLAFLLPPTRALIRRLAVRRFAGRVFIARPGSARANGHGFDVDGTASEVDPRALP